MSWRLDRSFASIFPNKLSISFWIDVKSSFEAAPRRQMTPWRRRAQAAAIKLRRLRTTSENGKLMLATAWAKASPPSKVGFFVAIVVLDNTALQRVGRVPPGQTTSKPGSFVSCVRRRDSEEFDIQAWI